MAGMLLESPVATDMTKPSLIETMHSTAKGEIPLLARHLRRLHASAQTLGYPCPLPEIEQVLLTAAHQAQAQRLRLLLHPGGRFESSHQPLPDASVKNSPQLVILAEPRLDASDFWLYHKTTHRPLYARATSWLQSNPEYIDCLFLNQHHQLCEGSISNLYLQLDGAWYTPPITCGVLPGIMRETLLESGEVRERILHLDDLAVAQGVRISNAVRGWLDVCLDQTSIKI